MEQRGNVLMELPMKSFLQGMFSWPNFYDFKKEIHKALLTSVNKMPVIPLHSHMAMGILQGWQTAHSVFLSHWGKKK